MSNKQSKLTPQQQEFENRRQVVMEQELSARSWKAHYEKMYYTIKSEEITPEYNEVQKKVIERAERDRKNQQLLQDVLDGKVTADELKAKGLIEGGDSLNETSEDTSESKTEALPQLTVAD